MGKGLSYIIQLLNPEIIVFSGPLAKAKQYVLSPIQQSLNRYCLEKISAGTLLLISDMGERSALYGTAEMIFQKVFNEINITEGTQFANRTEIQSNKLVISILNNKIKQWHI